MLGWRKKMCAPAARSNRQFFFGQIIFFRHTGIKSEQIVKNHFVKPNRIFDINKGNLRMLNS